MPGFESKKTVLNPDYCEAGTRNLHKSARAEDFTCSFLHNGYSCKGKYSKAEYLIS